LALAQVNVGPRETPVAPLPGKTRLGVAGGAPVSKDQVGEVFVPAVFLATILQ
jgi:hypothetical protein